MNVKLKPISEQVVVITGASSGIGLATARLAAERGAKLVLAARNEDALKTLTDELTAGGHEAVYVVADVGNEDDVKKIGQTAAERFGGLDTWVNNAATGIYGLLTEVADADSRQLFETNFWGTVYGSLEAVRQLKSRGGALVNVGSALSDRAIPVQGMYATSKHAVTGITRSISLDGRPFNIACGQIDIGNALTDMAVAMTKGVPQADGTTRVEPVMDAQVVADTVLHMASLPEGANIQFVTVMATNMPFIGRG